jgi:uncharacterized protein YqjF (DUF2071 family)
MRLRRGRGTVACVQPEPVTATAPRSVVRPLLRQSWRNVAFLHWTVDTALAARLLPPGVVPDLFGGRTFIGIVGLRMQRTAALGAVRVPWLGTLGQVNVRLYSVDDEGRRGVVFLRLHASRLVAALAGRSTLHLPYSWSRTQVYDDDGDQRVYLVEAHSGRVRDELVLRVGRRHHPNQLERFLVNRWGLHTRLGGRTVYLPVEHDPWPLQVAEPVQVSTGLIHDAGLATVTGPPLSVLFSPGIDDVRVGPPQRRPARDPLLDG